MGRQPIPITPVEGWSNYLAMKHGRATMPWGKYKGLRVRQIPSEYLSWLTTTFVFRTQDWKWLKDSVEAEMKFRGLNVENAAMPDAAVPQKEEVIRRIELEE